jgi:hypothetical protein
MAAQMGKDLRKIPKGSTRQRMFPSQHVLANGLRLREA